MSKQVSTASWNAAYHEKGAKILLCDALFQVLTFDFVFLGFL